MPHQTIQPGHHPSGHASPAADALYEAATCRLTLEAVRAFNEAVAARDVDAVMACMTEDCVFEDTRPAPDGARAEGAAAVRAAWASRFERSPESRFEAEDVFAAGDRCVVLWTYHGERDGEPERVRGVDVLRVRDGKVCEKLSYVKG